MIQLKYHYHTNKHFFCYCLIVREIRLFDYAASVWAYEPTLKPSTHVTITQAHECLQDMVLQDILDYNKDLKKNGAEKRLKF